MCWNYRCLALCLVTTGGFKEPSGKVLMKTCFVSLGEHKPFFKKLAHSFIHLFIRSCNTSQLGEGAGNHGPGAVLGVWNAEQK